MEISILLGFTAVVLCGLLFHRLRNKLTAMICTGACGFTIYILSKSIFDQAFLTSSEKDFTLWISLGISLVVMTIVGYVLMKLTVRK
jgi:zinc transporter ZupT